MHHRKAIGEIRAFNRFYTNIIGVVDRHVLGSPFSLTEARILLEISRRGDCNARSIRELLNVDEGYLSRTIDKLVKQGFVAKCRSARDGRVFTLSLTGKGRRAFSALQSRSESAIGTMIRHLSSDEVDEIVQHMRRIQALLSGTEDEGGSRA